MGEDKRVVRIKESDLGKVSIYVGLEEETVIIVERTELKNPKWKDEEGNEITKFIAGQNVKLSVECDGVLEGSDVIFKLFFEGADTGKDYPIQVVRAQNKEGIAEISLDTVSNIGNLHVEKTEEDVVKVIYVAEESEGQTVQSNPTERDGNEINDSSEDCWTMEAAGTLVYNGTGWLKDQNNNPVLNAVDGEIGANGIETGLLNILFERKYAGNGEAHGSNGLYNSFSGPEKDIARDIMENSGLVHSGGDDPNNWRWDTVIMVPVTEKEGYAGALMYSDGDNVAVNLKQLNRGKALDMDYLMREAGNTVATQVFIRYYLKAATDRVANGHYNSPHRVPNKAESRLRNYTEVLRRFYRDLDPKVANKHIPRNSEGKIPLTSDFLGNGYHVGLDIGIDRDTPLFSLVPGRVASMNNIGMDHWNEPTYKTDPDPTGKDVRIDIGFKFEKTFISADMQFGSFHMNDLSEIAMTLKVGNVVKPGTPIGPSGNTGKSTGAHAHFEIRGPWKLNNGQMTTVFTPLTEIILAKIGAPDLNTYVGDSNSNSTANANFFERFSHGYVNINSWVPEEDIQI